MGERRGGEREGRRGGWMVMDCWHASLLCLLCVWISLREVINVNQDPLGIQGRLISSSSSVTAKRRSHEAAAAAAEGKLRVYSRPLQYGDVAVALLNTNSFSGPHNIQFNFKDVRA